MKWNFSVEDSPLNPAMLSPASSDNSDYSISENKGKYNFYNKDISPSVLLIEDNLIVQSFMEILLKKLECSVTIASDGKEALAAYNHDFDLVILDLGLPDIEGYEIAKYIREQEKLLGIHTPIIVSSAYPMEEIQEKCREVGVDEIHGKLKTVEDIQPIFQRWLKKKM